MSMAKMAFEGFLRIAAVSEEAAVRAYSTITGHPRSRIERIEDRGPMAHPQRYEPGTREFFVYERRKA